MGRARLRQRRDSARRTGSAGRFPRGGSRPTHHIGRVFNGTSPHPYKLPDHKTKTSWKSDSSPGSGGFNEITFEDAKGREKVFMHAQKDREEIVREKHSIQVGKDLDVLVGERESRKVGADQTLHVVGSRTTRVEQRDVLVVGGECHIQVGETGASLSQDRVVLSTGKASLTIAGGDIFLDASGSIKVSAGALAGFAGREVHIDGAPNVLLNTAGATSPVPMSLGAAEINLADLAFPDAVNNAAKALQAKVFDEIPGGFDEQAALGALRRLLEEPPASLADAPGYLMMPEAINEQLQAAIDKVLDVPGVIVSDILDRVALEQKKLAERLEQIRARAGEIAGDVQEKIRGAVEDLRARAEAAKQMAIAKFEEVKGKLEAAKAEVQAKIQELRGKLEEAKARAVAMVEEFKGKLEAAKAAVLGKVNEVKEKFAEAKARVEAKIDEIKGRIEAVKEQAKAKIEEIKGRINEVKEAARAKVQEIKERVIALKDQAVERFQEMKKQAGEIIEMAKTQVEAAKARVQELKARIEGAKEEVKAKVQEWKGKVEEWKAQAKAKVEEVKAQAKAVVDDVKGQIESAKETVKQTIADAKELIADVKAIPKEFVAETKAAWNETKAEAKKTWEDAKETWKQTKTEAKETWNQTKAEAKQTVEGAKEAWGDIKGDAKEAFRDIKNEAEDFWGDLKGQGKDAAEGSKDVLSGAKDQGQGALGDAKSALQNAFGGGGSGPSGSNAIAGPQGHLGQIVSRAGGFSGDDVAGALNSGSNGATILQSPGEGQLFVMKTQGAMPVSGGELEAHLVEAQMNGFSSNDAFVHTLTQKGYVVYERPWGELAEAFVKRAAVI